ncbi:MAG: hypothetical protein ABI342_01665 [Nitrososphaera sp.]|jgi:hypothetical protein
MNRKSIILIGFSALAVILVIISSCLLFSFSGFQPIASVNFPNNTVLDIQKAVIYPSNNYGIFPSDKLLLQITVDKKIPDFVTIKPLIYDSVGGIPVTKSEDQKWQGLGGTEAEIFNYEFYAGSEGQNTVNVAINTTNPTEKIQFVEFINGTSNSFEVLSTSDRLLSSQNSMILIGILVSGFGSAVALILTAIQTKMTRDEKNQTQRAWVGNADSHIALSRVFNTRDQVVVVEEWGALTPQQKEAFDPDEFEYFMKIRNFGKTTATNIKARTMISSDPRPKKEVILQATYGSPFILFPDQEQQYMMKFSKKITDAIEERRKIYLITEFAYNSGDSKKIRKFGFIAELSTGGYVFLETWDEKTF